MLRNQICRGWVLHRRQSPPHEFRYPVDLLCVEMGTRYESKWLSSGSKRRPLRFGRAEWLGGEANPLGAINRRLQAAGFPACERAFALGQPRSFGAYFNPVCFYFCMNGSDVAFLIAEINNTPWDEKFSYVLDARGQQGEMAFAFPKQFHVSPFLPMDMEYRWRVKLRDDCVEVAMHLYREGMECFFAGMYLRNEPLTDAGLRRLVFRRPLQSISTLARIYWQALRLHLKRARFHPHPESPEEVTST